MADVDWSILANSIPRAADPVSVLALGAQQRQVAQEQALKQQQFTAQQAAAQRAQAAQQQASRQWSGGDTRGAQATLLGVGANDLLGTLNSTDKQDFDQREKGLQAVGGFANYVMTHVADAAARTAVIQHNKPLLVAAGAHPEDIDAVAGDPSDAVLGGIAHQYYSAKDQDATITAQQTAATNAQNAQTQAGRLAYEISKPVEMDTTKNYVVPGGAPTPATGAATAGHLDPAAFYKQFVLPHEGGYAAHDANGAPVNFGINQSANPGVDVRSLTPDSAAKIFTDKYYAQSRAANLPPALAAVHADTAFINPARAQQFLQQSGGDPAKYMALREGWMNHLVQSDPAKYGPYAKAWGTRNSDLTAYANQVGNNSQSAPSAPAGWKTIQTGVPKVDHNAVDASDPSIELAARQYVVTGDFPPLGMGNGPMRKAILDRAAEIVASNHWTPAQIAANKADYKGSAAALAQDQKQFDTIVGAEETAKANGQRMVDLSKYAPGNTPVAGYNAARNYLGRQFGDSRVTDMDAAHLTFTSEQARVLSSSPNGSGQLTDSARHEATETINGNASPEQKQSALNVLVADMEARKAAIQRRIDARTDHIRHLGDPTGARPSVPANAAAYLKSNPGLRAQFDAKYGAGAAASVLGH